MIIKVSEKEALKMLKWRERRKAKKWKRKHDKKKAQNPNFAKAWDNFIEEIDRLIAGYNESQRQYFSMCKGCGNIFPYEWVLIDNNNDAWCNDCKKL